MQTDHFLLEPSQWVPNNQRLPVLLYRGLLADPPGEDRARAFEALLTSHDWPAQWRDGIYDYHHYHSTAHEALGVAAGTARLLLGGPDGRDIDVTPGDLLVLPVGTGHCRISASEDFLVVGAYPAGMDWDICKKAPTPEMRQKMAALPIPPQDPATGPDGPLTCLWTHEQARTGKATPTQIDGQPPRPLRTQARARSSAG